MSSKTKGAVPDAWDDDWESLADKQESEEATPAPQSKQKISKAEKRAQHAEENRKLWKAAEEPPEPFVFLEARDNVPLKSEFKSSVKVLSRQVKVPPPSRKAHGSGEAGRAAVAEEEDSDDDAAKKPALSAAERQEKARREREEKQRKYQEAREKLFGPSKAGTENLESRDASIGNRSISQKSSLGTDIGDSEGSKMDRLKASDRKYQDGSSFPKAALSVEKPIRSPKGPERIGRNGAGFVMKGRKRDDTSS